MQSFGQSYRKHEKLRWFNSEWICVHKKKNLEEQLRTKRDSTSNSGTP